MTYNMPYARRAKYTAHPRCETCGKYCFTTTNDAKAFVAHLRRVDPRGQSRVYWYRCGQFVHFTRASMNHEGEDLPELIVRMY